MNAHRINWRSLPGEKGRTCLVCGTHAATVRAQQIHADVYEPGALPTEGVLIDEEGDT